MPAVDSGLVIYAQKAFLRSHASLGRVTGLTVFIKQRRLVLSVTTSSLMAELKAPEAPRDNSMSHSTARHPYLEFG